MHVVELARRPLGALASILTADQRAALMTAAARARKTLAGRVIWNVNATATGGGVAEILQTLVGPAVSGVTDDPEGAEVLDECVTDWRQLPASARSQTSLVSVPMDDLVKNATIINAVQGYADVVTQKSLAEGFGLTVTEAMWKGRPIVGAAVGGIQDQITDGQDGLLIEDATDLDAFAKALRRLFREPDLAHELGHAAHRRVLADYLDDRHLARTVDLLAYLVGAL